MLVNNILALIRGNLLCVFLKIKNYYRLSYHPYLRIKSQVSIILDKHSRIMIGKGVLINSRSNISSTDGGILEIGEMVGINCNSMVMCHQSITIGDNTIMGPGVLIYDHDHIFDSQNGVKRNEFKTSPVVIGQNCWIGANSIILRGTRLGNNCLVAAGSVVKGNYPDGSVIIQKREEIVKQN